jgi:hypothetical protein
VTVPTDNQSSDDPGAASKLSGFGGFGPVGAFARKICKLNINSHRENGEARSAAVQGLRSSNLACVTGLCRAVSAPSRACRVGSPNGLRALGRRRGSRHSTEAACSPRARRAPPANRLRCEVTQQSSVLRIPDHAAGTRRGVQVSQMILTLARGMVSGLAGAGESSGVWGRDRLGVPRGNPRNSQNLFSAHHDYDGSLP